MPRCAGCIYYGSWINATNEQARIIWSSETEQENPGFIDPCLDLNLLLQHDTVVVELAKYDIDAAGPSHTSHA